MEGYGSRVRCRLVACLPCREGGMQLSQKMQRPKGLKLTGSEEFGVESWPETKVTSKAVKNSCCNKPYN